MMRGRWKSVAALAAAAVVGGLLCYHYLTALASSAERERLGACLALEPQQFAIKAPPFALPDLEGDRTRLASSRGRVVLLNFWATWCPPCVEELPSMVRLQRALADTDFQLLTVSVDDDTATVKQFLARHRRILGELPVLMDPDKGVARSYGTVKFPESYLIDRRGYVRYRFINKRDWSSPTSLACIRSLL